MKKFIFVLILTALTLSCFSASISGRVLTDNDVNGIPGIRVAYIGDSLFTIPMLDSIYSNGINIENYILAYDITDQNGYYSIQITPGTEGIVVAQDILNFHFMEQFIGIGEDSVNDFENAGIFVFDEMDINFTQFDFMLHTINLIGNNTISGTITPPTNTAGLNIEFDVRLEYLHSHVLPPYTCTVSTNSPSFAFNNIRDGVYRLKVFSRFNPNGNFYHRNDTLMFARLAVRGGQTIDTVNVELPDIQYNTITFSVNDDSENPLSDAEVTLVSLNSDLNYSIITDTNGSAVIDNLINGRYTISVEKDNFQRTDNYGNIITVSNDQNYTFEMSPVQVFDNSISGVVSTSHDFVDPPTFPTMAIAVSSDDEESWVRTSTVGGSTGQFVLRNLPSDDYYVYVISSDAPPTFFPNTDTWETAQTVLATGDVENIDVVITPATNEGSFSVSGNVMEQSGRALISEASVILYNDDNVPVGFSITGENGRYFINNLRSGNYTRKVTKLNYNSQSQPFQLLGNSSCDLFIQETQTANDNVNIASEAIELRCYPNPFNPETTIEYSINRDSNVEIIVFNIKGQKVYTFQPEFKEKGIHKVKWSGVSDSNQPVASGVYFYQLKTETESRIRKMLLLK